MRKACARVQKLHERLVVEPALTVQRTSRVSAKAQRAWHDPCGAATYHVETDSDRSEVHDDDAALDRRGATAIEGACDDA